MSSLRTLPIGLFVCVLALAGLRVHAEDGPPQDPREAGDAAARAGRWEEAIEHWRAFAKRARENGDKASEGEAYRLLATGHGAQKRPDDAAELFKRALSVLAAANDPAGIARTLLSRGTWHYMRGAREPARADLTKALGRFESLNALAGAHAAATNLGLLLEDAGLLEEALAAHERARAVAARMDDPSALAQALLGTASVLHRLGRDVGALARIERAIDLAREAKDPRGEGQGKSELATIQLDRGRTERAIASWRAALRLFEQAQDARLQARTLGNLGTAHERRGEFAEALRRYEEALERIRTSGDTHGEATALLNLGSLHTSLGQYTRASRRLDEALRGFAMRGDRGGEVRAHLALAAVAAHTEEDGARQEHIASAHAAAKDLDDLKVLASVQREMAALARARGDASASLQHLEDARSRTRAAGDVVGVVACDLEIAELRLHQGLLQAAEDRARPALEAARGADARTLEIASLVILAEVELAREKPKASVALAREAAEALPFLLQGMDDLRGARARARWRRAYTVGMRASLATGDVERALWFVEAGRGAQLRASLGGLEAVGRHVLPASLRHAEAAARGAVRRAQDAFGHAVHRQSRRRLRSARRMLQRARQAHRDVAARIQLEAAVSQDTLYPKPSRTRALQAAVAPDEALVTYAMGNGAVAFVISTDGVRVVTLGAETEVRAACEAIHIVDDSELPANTLLRARAALRDPLALPTKVRRVIVSPAGPMAQVPFALVFPEREVSYAASATTHALMHERRALRGLGILGLGDPEYRGRLAPLPNSRDEVLDVADVRLLGEDASEARLRAELPQRRRWRAVHLACHGLVDHARPGLSFLALSRDTEHDGNLTVSDVLGLRVPADLVTLSACDTGRGTVVAGEGVLGFTRAFMVAGASRVLVSLWQVDDAATSALMRAMYRRWQPPGGSRGVPLAQALREAQAEIRSVARWRHPYFWAAWCLWGPPDAAPNAREVLSIEQVATRVVEAQAAGDDGVLAALALVEDPDVWRVVDHLDRAGESAAAQALANRAPNAHALKVYLRRKRRTAPPWRERLRASRHAEAQGDTSRAREALASDADLAEDVLGLDVRRARARLDAAKPLVGGRRSAVGELLDCARTLLTLGWNAEAARGMQEVGRLAARIGAHDTAVEAWRALVNIEKARKRRAAVGRAAGDLSVALQRAGRLADAESAAEEALAALADSTVSAARVRANLAGLLFARGRANEAAVHARKAREDARVGDAPKVEAAALANLGLALGQLGQVEPAIEVQVEALSLLEQVRDTARAAIVHDNLANLLAEQGRTVRAVEHHRRAVELMQRRGDAAGEARAQGNAAMTYLSEGLWTEASEAQSVAVEVADELGHLGSRVRARLATGLIEQTRGRLGRARKVVEEALTLAEAATARACVMGAQVSHMDLDPLAAQTLAAQALELAGDNEPDVVKAAKKILATVDALVASTDEDGGRDHRSRLRRAVEAADAPAVLAAAWRLAAWLHIRALGGSRAAAASLQAEGPEQLAREAQARIAVLEARNDGALAAGEVSAARASLERARATGTSAAWPLAHAPPDLKTLGRITAHTGVLLLTFRHEDAAWCLRVDGGSSRIAPLDKAIHADDSRRMFVVVDAVPDPKQVRKEDVLTTPRALMGLPEQKSGQGTIALTGPRPLSDERIEAVLGRDEPTRTAAFPQGLLSEIDRNDLGIGRDGPARLVIFDHPLFLAHDRLARCGIWTKNDEGQSQALALPALARTAPRANVWVFPHVASGASPSARAAFAEVCARGGAGAVLLRHTGTPAERDAFLRAFTSRLSAGTSPATAYAAAGGASAGWELWGLSR